MCPRRTPSSPALPCPSTPGFPAGSPSLAVFPHGHHRPQLAIPLSDDRNCRDRYLPPLLVRPEEPNSPMGGHLLGKGDHQRAVIVVERRAVEVADDKYLGQAVRRQLAGIFEAKTDDLLGGLVVIDESTVAIGYLDRHGYQTRPLFEQDHLNRVLSHRPPPTSRR